MRSWSWFRAICVCPRPRLCGSLICSETLRHSSNPEFAKPPLPKRECGFSGFSARVYKLHSCEMHAGLGTDPAKVPAKRSVSQRLFQEAIHKLRPGRRGLPGSNSINPSGFSRQILVKPLGFQPGKQSSILCLDANLAPVVEGSQRNHPSFRSNSIGRDLGCYPRSWRFDPSLRSCASVAEPVRLQSCNGDEAHRLGQLRRGNVGLITSIERFNSAAL